MPDTESRHSPGMLHVEEDILRSIPDVVLRYRADGIVDWASPSLEHVFGYRPADVVGTAFRMSHADDRDRVDAAARSMVATGSTAATARYPVVRADGSTTLVEVSGRAEYDESGELRYMIAVMREMSDRGVHEQLYRLLADNTSDVVLVYDPRSVVLWASPSTHKVLGHDPAELVGSSRTIVHPEDAAGAREIFRAAIAEKARTLRNRARVRRADGTYLWMDVSAVLIWSESGELEYEITSLRDVDDQVAVERDLRESLQRYHLLLENTSDVLYQFDDEGRLVWITPNVTDLTGWQPEELVGRYRLDFVHPEDAALADAARQDSPDGGLPMIEIRLRTRDGGFRWVEVSTGTGDEGSQIIAGVGVIRDIHARRQTQAALAASEEIFRSAMRDSAVGMCLVSPDGAIVQVNQALCDFLARDPEALRSLRWQDVADPAEVPEDLQVVDELLAGRRDSMRGVRRYARPDGTWVVGDLTVSAVRGDDGAVTLLVVQIIDVTEQTRVQERLRESEGHYRLLADSVSDVVSRSDDAGIITWASRSLTAATGWTPQDLVGRPLLDLVHPNDIEIVQHAHAGLSDAHPARVEIRLLTADGTYRWFAVAASQMIDDSGAVTGRVATWRDISGEVATRRLLAQREAEFREIAEHAADIVLRLDAGDAITWASPSVREIAGYVSRDLVGHDPKMFIHPDDLLQYREFAHSLQPNVPARLTVRVRCADDEYRWFSVIATRIFGGDGEMVGQIIGMRNIDGEVKAVEALARSEEQFRLAMNSAPGGMAVLDLDGRFAQANQSLADMLGHDRRWLTEHRVRDVVDPDDWPAFVRMHDRLNAGEIAAAMEEIRLIGGDGRTVWVESSLAILRADGGPAISFVAQFVDVTQAREARAALRHAATHDPLTLLGNRRGLSEDLETVLSRTPRTGTRVGILTVDLDGLKPVNDQYGHAAGDEVLVRVGERLRGAVRKDDPIARVGGDEFVVVLVAVHTVEQVAHLAEKVREVLSQAIALSDGAQVRITASIGAVIAGPQDDPDSLLRRADAALYEAKHSGRDRVVVKDA